MIFRFLALFGLLGFFGHAQDNDPTSYISWDDGYQLKWTDFQGNTEGNFILAASTSYKIDLLPESVLVDENDQIQGYEKLTVVANFYKNTSWHTTNSQYILKHERLHFDIAELFARKIRKRFSELKKGKQASFAVYQDAFTLFWKECRKMQKQYDLETNHGRKLEVNEIWQTRILKELESLVAFKATHSAK